MSRKTSLKQTLSHSKHQTKRAYVWAGLITMVAVAVFVKPVRYSFSALRQRLLRSSSKEKRAHLREVLHNTTQPEFPTKFNKRKSYKKSL